MPSGLLGRMPSMPTLLRQTNRRWVPQAFAGLQLLRAEFAHELPGQQGPSLVPLLYLQVVLATVSWPR